MSKLYKPLESNVVSPSLEATIIEESASESREFIYTPSNKLYASLVPEKPAILAEERIFVYVPKVGYDNAGIAKFAKEQFNIVNGEVSIKESYLAQFGGSPAGVGIPVTEMEPVDPNITIWYKIVT